MFDIRSLLGKARKARFGGRSFARDDAGTAALEFAIVSMPFLIMVYGVINGGMYFYAVNCVDRGVEDAARFIRTGEAQKGTIPGGSGSALTVGGFKSLVCAQASSFIDCSKLQILIQSSAPDWAAINPMTCPTSGNLAAGAISSGDNTPVATVTGTQGAHVLITACYKWELGAYLPFVHFDTKFGDGSTLIQSSVALQIEPYL